MAGMSLGKRIKEARERLRWTQQQLADKLGVDRKTIDNWENDRTTPRSSMGALKHVLNDDLNGGGPQPPAEVARNQDDPVVGYVWGLDLAEEVRLGIIRIYLRQVGRAGLAAASSARVA